MNGRTMKGIYLKRSWLMKDYWDRLYKQGWRMVKAYRDYRGSSCWIGEFVRVEVNE